MSLAALRNKNLLEQAPPLATHIVRSHRDLAKPYLQVVHSGVLASSDPPVRPRPIEGHTCAQQLGHYRLQRCFALDCQDCGSLHMTENLLEIFQNLDTKLSATVFWHPPTPRTRFRSASSWTRVCLNLILLRANPLTSNLGALRPFRPIPNHLHVCGGFLSRGL